MRTLRHVALLAALALSVGACADNPTITATPVTGVPLSSSELRKVQVGDTVTVKYTGTLDDGSIFDSSEGKTPFVFVVGSGDAIEGFDRQLRGMSIGQSGSFRLEPAIAYGERDEALVMDIPRTQMPDGAKRGDWVRFANGTPAMVLSEGETTVQVDTNHWLAGKALTFEVTIVAIG